MCVPMVAHFCKSGVIRPLLSDVFYTLQNLQRTLAHLFFFFLPFLYLYSFPRGFIYADKNILVFPVLFEGSQCDPPGWGVCARLCCWGGFVCVVTVRMCWAGPGLVGLATPGWDKDTEGSESPHEAEWRGVSPCRHQLIPSSSAVHRAETVPAWAGGQWLSVGFHVSFCA